MIARRASWHAAILLLVVSCAASFVSMRSSARTLQALRPALDPDSYFGALRRPLGDTRRITFFTNQADSDSRVLHIVGAQYALVPTVIGTDRPRRLPKRILEGDTLVLDYTDGALLDRDLSQLREWCAGNVEMTVTRVSPGLCLVQTHPR